MSKEEEPLEPRIKEILEKSPVIERLSDLEHAEMRRRFVVAIQESGRSSRVVRFPANRRMVLWGLTGGMAACFLFLWWVSSPMYRGQEPGNSKVYLFFEGERTLNDGQTGESEVEEATAEIRSSSRFRVNQIREDALCGPRSLWVAAALNGKNLDLGELIRQTVPAGEECSLWDLKQAAVRQGFEPQGMKLDWDSLTQLKSSVILHVRSNHFVCVDPRERREDSIRYYDSPETAKWVSRKDLEAEWDGASLVLGAPPISYSEGPQIQFDRALHDFGTVYDRVSVTATFPFRNVGTDPLEIREIEHSCGCLSATPGKWLLLPGEESEIRAEIALQSREGTQVQMLDVVTNDPRHPKTTLILKGFHQRSLVPAVSQVNFGVVSPSLPVTKSFVVEDRRPERSEGNLQFAYTFQNGSVGSPTLRARIAKKTASGSERSDVRLRQPDVYEISLEMSASRSTQPGPYYGEIAFTADTAESKEIRLPFQVVVTTDYLQTPHHVSFGIIHPGETKNRKIVIESRMRQSLNYVKHDVEYQVGECSLEATREEKGDETDTFVLSLSIPDTTPSRSSLAKGFLILQWEGGPQMEVPWSAVIK